MSETHSIDIDGKEYVQVYTPDWKEFALLLDIAKGADRSMGAFARACGISPATVTRIVKGYYKKGLKLEYLIKIVENAASETEVSLISLVRANGYRALDEYERVSRFESEVEWENHKLLPNEFNMEIRPVDLHEIISKAFFQKGVAFLTLSRRPVKQLGNKSTAISNSNDGVPESKLGLNYFDENEGHSIVTFHIQGVEPKYLKYSGYISDERVITSKEMLWKKLAPFNSIFLRDAWEPQAARDFSYTIVFRTESAFDIFVEAMQNVRVNNYISAILVDAEAKTVSREYAVSRIKGKPFLIFN